jgi:hypothetical protein
MLPQKFLIRFLMLRVRYNAVYRTHIDALRFVEETNAFGALAGIDLVDFLALMNRFIRAFGFTHIAVDAFVSDHEGHNLASW